MEKKLTNRHKYIALYHLTFTSSVILFCKLHMKRTFLKLPHKMLYIVFKKKKIRDLNRKYKQLILLQIVFFATKECGFIIYY